MKPISLKKFKEEKKESEDGKDFRRNFYALDAWEKEMLDRYTTASESMKALFKHINQEWRDPDDHLPRLCHLAMRSIFNKLNKKRS